MEKRKVIGLGGIFFKSKNPLDLKLWYKKHLGIDSEEWGTIFKFTNDDGTVKKGCNLFSPFGESTQYLNPSDKDFMINFIVDDLDYLIETLREGGVDIVGEPVGDEFGKFAWILDPEGIKIELWEPPEEKS